MIKDIDIKFHNTSADPPDHIVEKGDSAATAHHWCSEDLVFLQNVVRKKGPCVTLPNNTSITSSHQGQLPLSSALSSAAQTTAILPTLKSSSLISLGQLCDDNCKVLLTKKNLLVIKDQRMIINGTKH